MVIALAVAVVSVVITGVIRTGAGAGVVVDASYHSEESNKQTDRENMSHRISIRSPNSLSENVLYPGSQHNQVSRNSVKIRELPSFSFVFSELSPEPGHLAHSFD
jgi:hypothetical protein